MDIRPMALVFAATTSLATHSGAMAMAATGVETITIEDDEIYKGDTLANFGALADPALPAAWVVSRDYPRLDAVRVYADGSVRADVDPDSAVIRTDIRYVLRFESDGHVLTVVRTGDIADVRFTPSNAPAVAAFYGSLVNDAMGRVTLSDDLFATPTPNPDSRTARFHLPYLRMSEAYNARLVIMNAGGASAHYRMKFLTHRGDSAPPPEVTGTIEADTVGTIRLQDVVYPSWGDGALGGILVFDAAPDDIDVLEMWVNPRTGEIHTRLYLAR
ncbi:MAG: hypothetical protein F4029_00130 [Gammaproteobacteria bacterium]|nr:hypothetical protein [Gammaproteobacteria bacterium]MYF29628.1 hypothetical protein [Gammaproteobacteria bacterium]MYK44616.1 hypothetical protein [Gammaproteobacteria bacterium]